MHAYDLKTKLKDLSRSERHFKEAYLSSSPLEITISMNDGLKEARFFDGFLRRLDLERPGKESVFSDPIYLLGQYTDARAISSELRGRCVFVSRLPRYVATNVSVIGNVSIVYVLDGALTIVVEGNDCRLKSGNMVILSPGAAYSVMIGNDSTVALDIVIPLDSFRNEFARLFTEDGSIAHFFRKMVFCEGNPQCAVIAAPPNERAQRALFDIMELQVNPVAYSCQLIRAQAEFFIYNAFSSYEIAFARKVNADPARHIADSIALYARENLKDVSLKKLAGEFSYSPAYISQLLKKRFGKSYMELVEDIRLEKSKELLTSTELSIEEVCWLVGYGDSRYLRYLYRKRLGIAPGSVRRAT
jgi:AraC-like DNA-binding protein